MNSKPILSILMPVYNSATYLRQAIESVLAQDYQDFELLLLDDGSTDESVEILRSIKDTRLRILVDGQNLRQPYRYNQGVRLAQGKYIAIMHSDDIALPARFATQIAFLEKNPTYDMLGSFAKIIQGENLTTRHIGTAGEGQLLQLFCLFNSPFIHPTMLFRREVLEQNPYNTSFTTAEDYELWSRLLAKYKAINIPKSLLQLRIHPLKNAKRHKQQQLENIIQIVRAQSKQLGIKYQDDWENCTKWVSNSYLDALTKVELKMVESYLLALHRSLLNTQKFQAKNIENVLAQTWLRVCMKSGKNGLGVWWMYLQSPLSSKHSGLQAMAKLFVKCLLRM